MLYIPIFWLLKAEALPLVITLYTVIILFILCSCKSQLCFVVGKKGRHCFAIFIIFSPVSILRSVLAVRSARIILRGWNSSLHFTDIYWLMEHINLGNWGGKAICKIQYRHTGINKKTNSRKSVSSLVRVVALIIAGILLREWNRSCTIFLMVRINPSCFF